MGRQPAAGLAAPLLVAVLATGTLPEVSPALLTSILAALWLQQYQVPLGGTVRYSPASAAYLALGLTPGIGSATAAGLVLVEALRQGGKRFLLDLEARRGVLLALLAVRILQFLWPHTSLALVLGPLVYLAHQAWSNPANHRRLEVTERLRWTRTRLRMRPLEFCLAASAPAMALLCTLQPGLQLLLLPLLAVTNQLGAGIVLRVQNETAEQILQALTQSQAEQQRGAQRLARVERDKKLLEGFAAHLARQPGLEETAQQLVATVFELLEVEDVVIFLKSQSAEPLPEPFFYQVSAHHQARLQGSVLTGLREPLVDSVWHERRGQLLQPDQAIPTRLLPKNPVAVALPLGGEGVLYVGRARAVEFLKEELDSLTWLAGRAQLALQASLAEQNRRMEQQGQKIRLAGLEEQVEIFSVLMGSAHELGDSLDLQQLLRRLQALLTENIPHYWGSLQIDWLDGSTGVRLHWGEPPGASAEMLDALQASSQPWLLQSMCKTRWEAQHSGSLVATPLLGQGKLAGALALAAPQENAFDRKQAELLSLLAAQVVLAFSRARLYGQVVEARRQLEESQSQLVQSSKLTAIGQLAAGVAHELNTPLGAICLSLESAMERMEKRPEASRQMITKALSAVERSRGIVDKLLIYSRKSNQQMSTMPVEGLMADTLEFLSFQLRSAEIEVSNQPAPPGRLEINGRQQEVQQVLVNLVLNAVQAMKSKPKGERLLQTRTLALPDSVVLEVRDSGVGMSEAQMARIFEPFFTTKPMGEGTGLGLSVSQQIVMQHKGRLEVESQAGLGSTFRLVLPRS